MKPEIETLPASKRQEMVFDKLFSTPYPLGFPRPPMQLSYDCIK
jgi:hypothetical protein